MLAALILPADLVDRLNSLSTLTPGTPQVEVVVNEEDPVKARLVDDRITTLLAQANLASQADRRRRRPYLDLLVNGGSVEGRRPAVPDPRPAGDSRGSSGRCEPALPPGPLRDSLDQVIRFATWPAKTSTSPGR